ncbi:MAG: 3-isopropylmalate dehydrogenase [Defluviitaleaceae bacterium]|nr:3-isopropylmalate dehydrogenase [Defluviitaleaceae bacterium]
MMRYNIALIPGDGIGPEVIAQAVKALEKLGAKFGHVFNFTEADAGGVAIDKTGHPLPQNTIDVCRESDSVMLGAVGGWQWDSLPGDKRPERALLGLRGELGLYANLRPAVLYDALKDACPLRKDIAEGGIDIMVVRELTGGMYFGDRGRKQTVLGEAAWDTEMYAYEEVRRIAITAFDIARQRSKRVTNVDKANVLESSRLWRSVVLEVAKNYPDVALDHMYVDNASMQLIRDPRHFDVLVTTNMFGDILSDEASQITGSIGMLPSASLCGRGTGMYEPIHGSAPDIAGKDLANPIATILSAAMMLKYSFKLEEEAQVIEDAVSNVLDKGFRTGDIMSPGMKQVGTKEMGRLILDYI